MKVLNLENMLKTPKILTREMMGEAWEYFIDAAPDAMTTQDWKVYEVCDMDKAALPWASDVKFFLMSPVGHVFAYYDLVAV